MCCWCYLGNCCCCRCYGGCSRRLLPFSQCTAALFLLQSIRFEAIVAVGGTIAASMLLLLQLGLMQLMLLCLLQYLLLILLLLVLLFL